MCYSKKFYTEDYDRQEHPLEQVFSDVILQVKEGKGRERHSKDYNGGDLTFYEQPLMIITKFFGSGFPLGQAVKKLTEVPAIFEQKGKEAAYNEILGAIAYAAAAALQFKVEHD